MIRACLDADVLIPLEPSEFLLTAAEHGVYEAVTSPLVPEETHQEFTGM